MKAILLAAGRGTRISERIDYLPKSTLLVDNEPLIKRTVKMLLARRIDVCVVVGYRQERVRECLAQTPVTIVENPFYAVTNSLASLWLAKEFWTNDDMLLMNADLLVDDAIMDSIIAETRSPVMAADPKRIQEGDFFFSYTQERLLTAFGKTLPIENRSGEYLGIAKVQRSHRFACLQTLKTLVRQERYDDWWERILYHQVERGSAVHVMEVYDGYWSEIDTYEDYLSINAALRRKRLHHG